MAKIGFLGPGVPGHWNPTSCLARALQAQGHEVLAFQLPYYEGAVRNSGVNYCPIGEQIFPPSRTKQIYAQAGELKGMDLLRYMISMFTERSKMYLDEAPELLERTRIKFLVVDQIEPAGASIAERLQIPFVTISNALVLNQEPSIPPFFTAWPYSTNPVARLRNQITHRMVDNLTKPWLNSINSQRREWKLREYRTLWESGSPTSHLSQQPTCFDFPHRQLPPQFHYTGPWHDSKSRPMVPFPFERLDERPLIYASMGTIQNRVRDVFHKIAAACIGLNAQVVISLGGGSTPEDIGPLPGNPLVVSTAPQLDLLQRATLTITHAGLNTVLESLSYGVPMIAIPVGNDQPGVAARLKSVGAGEFLPLGKLTPTKLTGLIHQVLEEPGYRKRAREMMAEIKKSNGVQQAAQLIGSALTSNQQSSDRLACRV